jgi:hypothetical protein
MTPFFSVTLHRVATALRNSGIYIQFHLSLSERNKNNKIKLVGFQVLMAVCTKMALFWVVAPCKLVRFIGV